LDVTAIPWNAVLAGTFGMVTGAPDRPFTTVSVLSPWFDTTIQTPPEPELAPEHATECGCGPTCNILVAVPAGSWSKRTELSEGELTRTAALDGHAATA